MGYRDRVFEFLNTLPPNEIIDLAVKVQPSNRNNFVEIVKEYIDNVDCQIEFNTDYTKLRRLEYDWE